MPETQGTWVQSLGRKDPLEEGMATHSSILAWRTPMDREPGGRLQSIGQHRVRHDWSDLAHTMSSASSEPRRKDKAKTWMCRQDSDSQSQTGVRFVVTECSKPPAEMLSMPLTPCMKKHVSCSTRNKTVCNSVLFWTLCFIPFHTHHLFSFSSALSPSSPAPLLSPCFFSSRCADWWGLSWIPSP